MDDIVKDFLIESRENLDRLDQELVSLEANPQSKELLGSIFRTIHTIKGTCGFLGFAHLGKVAHAGENLLSKLRDGGLSLNPEITSALLAMVDAIRRMLNEIESTEADGESDYPELLKELSSLQAGPGSAGAKAVSQESAPDMSVAVLAESSPMPSPVADGPVASPTPAGNLAEHPRPSPSKIGSLLVERGCVQPEDLSFAIRKQEEGDRRRLGDILVACGACTQQDVDAAQEALEDRARHAAVETVRVGVDLVDTLMNLVSELVLARNQLLQFSNRTDDRDLQAVSQRINSSVTKMQEQIIKTRLQPIANVWNKFPRSVRDLALSCGKQVRLEMEGQDTELDRTIIEAMRDPLTHLVRNAIDHGIELPDLRRKLGKDAAGWLRLRACQEGGNVTVEVSDDGAGLNLERLCSKAIERGLITPQQARRMNDREIFKLIFLPGFSTAEKVSNVSGRGVGMDVVKTNVEKIGGIIDIESTPGKGTTIRVKIPLTLAIVPALIVSSHHERFTIPQASVLEVVSLRGIGSGGPVEMVHDCPVFRLRGRLLPLVYLDRELRLGKGDSDAQSATAASIVVLQADARKFGLVVDEILDTQEIVVKPLGEHLKRINLYSGATIMGDGRVALILDVLGLAQRANVIGAAQSVPVTHMADAVRSRMCSYPQSLLVVRSGPETQFAIPLRLITRLEGISADSLRRAGDREVMEYRGRVIPLLRLSELLPQSPKFEQHTAGDSIEVVIYAEQGHTIGIIVDCILDIIEEEPVIDSIISRSGVVGSFMSHQNIIEMVDLPAIIRKALPEFANPC
jgi:two-component system, chemotaxis family, sensor kinase CheA